MPTQQQRAPSPAPRAPAGGGQAAGGNANGAQARQTLAGLNHSQGQRFVSPNGGRAGQGGQTLLQQGSTGPEVQELQTKLKARGYPVGPIDGQFGPMTKSAVVQLQKASRLPVDGVVGPQTQAALAAAGPAAAPDGARQPGETPPAPIAASPHQVSVGAKGDDVILLQTELKKRGYDFGKVDGDFGPNTKRALIKFQSNSGLDADGVAGEKTWATLGYKQVGDAGDVNRGGDQPLAGDNAAPPPIPAQGRGSLRQKILASARAELGKRERGTNGGDATKYQGAFGRGKEPWCADFVSWVYTQSGKGMNNPYVPSIVAQLKKAGRWRTNSPKPGDMVIFDWDGDGVGDHIGIVEALLSDGSIRTIEGNTTNPNGNGQEGVFERTRTRSVILGYGDADG